MNENTARPSRFAVRVENPTGMCGHIQHMTIDDLKMRLVGEEFDGSCPACGFFHLVEVPGRTWEKIVDSERYAQILLEAEEKA
jgi:hypothetical protein